MPRTRARFAATLVVALVSAVAFLAGGTTASAHAVTPAATTRASTSGAAGTAARTTPVVLDEHASKHGDRVGAGGPAAMLPDTCALPAPGCSAAARPRARLPHEGTTRTTTDGRAPPA